MRLAEQPDLGKVPLPQPASLFVNETSHPLCLLGGSQKTVGLNGLFKGGLKGEMSCRRPQGPCQPGQAGNHEAPFPVQGFPPPA